MYTDVAILGNGLAGNLTAAYLRKKLPDLEVTVIGREDAKRPIVGESLVEFATRFFHEIGMGGLLEEKHYHKYGLTFIYKENLSEPDCRRYVVAESQGIPRMPSYLINREVFDADLEAMNRSNGIKYLNGWVRDVELRDESKTHHEISYTDNDEKRHTITSKFVIDASGRRGVLARKLKVRRKYKDKQRCCFWFRLRDFDKNYLSNLEATKLKHHCFDPYYATQHFFGKGNWIWNIPMRSEKERDLISIGLVWRPDIYPHDVRNIDDFLTHVKKEHPVITELVESGTVVDENLLLNYTYDSTQYYSADGWFVVGDAGFAPDPLFSMGTSLIATQITQIAAMLAAERQGRLTEQYASDLSDICERLIYNIQRVDLTDLYEIMHDPIQLHWKLMWSNCSGFHSLWPVLMKGYQADPALLGVLPRRESGKHALDSLLELVQENMTEFDPIEHTPNFFGESINWSLYRATDDHLGRPLSTMLWKMIAYRLHLMKQARSNNLLPDAIKLLPEAVKTAELAAKALLLRLYPSVIEKIGGLPMQPTNPASFSFLDPVLRGETVAPCWPELGSNVGEGAESREEETAAATVGAAE